MAELNDVENNVLKIAVGYSFHRDKIMEREYQNCLEEILSGLCSTKIKIEAIVVEKINNNEDEELAQLASTVGGEVIN